MISPEILDSDVHSLAIDADGEISYALCAFGNRGMHLICERIVGTVQRISASLPCLDPSGDAGRVTACGSSARTASEVALVSVSGHDLARQMAFEIVGREEDRASVEAFVGRAEGGASALVLEGEAGIGKSTVWLAGVELAR